MRICQTHPHPIDLLITDVVLPGMNGRQLAGLLTQLRPEMKVLYISGCTDDTILRRGVLEPGTLFLQKPFSHETLTRTVYQILNGSLIPVTRSKTEFS